VSRRHTLVQRSLYKSPLGAPTYTRTESYAQHHSLSRVHRVYIDRGAHGSHTVLCAGVGRPTPTARHGRTHTHRPRARRRTHAHNTTSRRDVHRCREGRERSHCKERCTTADALAHSHAPARTSVGRVHAQLTRTIRCSMWTHACERTDRSKFAIHESFFWAPSGPGKQHECVHQTCRRAYNAHADVRLSELGAPTLYGWTRARSLSNANAAHSDRTYTCRSPLKPPHMRAPSGRIKRVTACPPQGRGGTHAARAAIGGKLNTRGRNVGGPG